MAHLMMAATNESETKMTSSSTTLKLDPELQIMLDRMPPFTVSIEPVNRPCYAYGYHLGHDEILAKNFVRGMWRDYDNHHGQGLYTIALMRDGKIHDVFDGREWFSDSMNAFWDQAAADHRAELSSGVKILRAFKPIKWRDLPAGDAFRPMSREQLREEMKRPSYEAVYEAEAHAALAAKNYKRWLTEDAPIADEFPKGEK